MLKTKRNLRALLFGYGFWLFLPASIRAQDRWFELGYSHNDYLQKKPLFDALNNGYCHLEADVFLSDTTLIIAHWFPYLKSKRSLENLYLKPLQQYVETNNRSAYGSTPPLTLVIDIKSSPDKTYRVLRILLKRYESILSRYENGTFIQGSVNVIITGKKPVELISAEISRLVMLDDFLDHMSDSPNNNLFAMASCKYASVLKWTGKGRIPPKEEKRLMQLVNQAHRQGKKARLWASPENERVWLELLHCGIDYINTDQLIKLKSFYRSHNSPLQSEIQAAR